MNQGNTAERNAQVHLMGDIYHRAERVISWLGPESESSTLGMSTILHVFKSVVDLDTGGDKCAWLERYPALASEFGPSSAWVAVRGIFTRDYWRRVWIMQELILARDILLMCGDAQVVPWFCLVTVENWAGGIKATDSRPSCITLTNWDQFTSMPIINVPAIRGYQYGRNLRQHKDYESRSKDCDFLDLLAAQTCEVTDPRDKVFGILGLISSRIVPDYSISVHDPYLDTATKLIGYEKLTRILNIVGTRRVNPHGLPSWVPDWSVDTVCLPYSRLLFTAVEDLPKSGNVHVEGTILRVAGVCLSDTLELEPEPPVTSVGKNGPWTVLHLSERYLEKHGKGMYVTGIPSLQGVLRLLFHDEDLLHGEELRNDDIRLQIPSDSFRVLALSFVGALCSTAANSDHELVERMRLNLPKLGIVPSADFAAILFQRFVGADSPHRSWKSYDIASCSDRVMFQKVSEHLNSMLDGRRFFHTGSGYLGIGPEMMEAGDLLYGLHGCVYPVILRRVDSYYVLIGNCLVHGLKDREIQAILEGDSDLEQIEIH